MLKLLNQKSNKRGYTLLEMLLSIAIIALIAGIGTPIYQSFQNRNELDVAAQSFSQTLRRAQTLARSGADDSTWGVYATTSTITLFRGTSYNTRFDLSDEVTVIADNIAAEGTTEFVFSKVIGATTAGTTTFTSINNESRNVVVTDRGIVSY